MERWVCPVCGQESQGNYCGTCGNACPAVETPQFKVTFETGKPYKVHSSYVWLGPLVATLVFFAVAVSSNISSIIMGLRALAEAGIDTSAPLIAAAAIIGAVIIYGLIVVLYALAYKNMSYVFDGREFSFYSGIITKRRVHLPYARIQSVNHRASIIQRLAGVCTVTIDSAGGSSNKALRVPYLRLETAERLRVDLFVRKAAVAANAEGAVVYDPYADTASMLGAQAEAQRMADLRGAAPEAPSVIGAAGTAGVASPASAAGAPGMTNAPGPNVLDTTAGTIGDWRGLYGGSLAGFEPVSYELRLDNKELALTSFSHATPITLALIMGATALVTIVGAAFVGDAFSRTLIALSIPVVFGILLLTWIIGALGIGISYGNFRACRRGSRIEVERGLLQREFSGIDVSRIQSIEVRQSIIRRLIGYCEISLGRINAPGDTAGNKNDSSVTRGLIVHPFVKIDRVDEIVGGLLPEFADRPRESELIDLPAPALRRSVLRRCVWYNAGLYTALATAILWATIAAFPGNIGPGELAALGRLFILVFIVCLLYTAGRAVSAVLWARNSGYVWNRRYLMLRNGGLGEATSIVPRWKIQAGSTRDNPFQRRLALTTLRATTAAGTRRTSERLLDVPADVGTAYLEWLKPR